MLKNANAHFSDDLLSTLLNEPLVGHGVFWSSAGECPYPISIRTLSFQDTFQTVDPTYDAPALENYASSLRDKFRGAVEAAAAEVGGATVGGTVDASETLKRRAIYELGTNSDFHDQIRGEGVPWVAIRKWLVAALPETVGDREEWVFQQFLVERALTDILGENGWTKERRARGNDPSKTLVWYTATSSARDREQFETEWSTSEDAEDDNRE